MRKFPEFQNRDWRPYLEDLLDSQPGWVGSTLVSSLNRLWILACLHPYPWLLFQEALKLPSSLDSWSHLCTDSCVLGWKECHWPCLCWCWPDLSPATEYSVCSFAISLADDDCLLSKASSQPVVYLMSYTPSYHSPEHTNGILLQQYCKSSQIGLHQVDQKNIGLME